MSFRHFWAVTKKETSHILRDRYTLFLVTLSPTLLLLLMAYALSVDISHVPVAVWDQDQSQVSRSFIQEIISGQDVDLYASVSSMDEVENLLQRGDIKAAVIIGHGFADEINGLTSVPLLMIIDGTEPESGGFAVDHIGLRAEEYISNVLQSRYQEMGLELNTTSPIDLRVRAWFNPSLKTRNDLIPGLLSIVLGLPAMLVALTIAHEREHGTLEQLLATPIQRAELLLGKMFPYLVVGMVNVIFIPILAILWFHVPFHGNFVIFFLLSAIFMFAILSMGIVVGVFMRTQSAALALSFLLIFFPGFFLTGIFFPIVSMPEVMRMESLGMPGTHYGIITRGVFLSGVGFETLWPYAVMLAILGVGFTAVASMFFKKKLG
ncbi:ABC transporter permease [bacterium]|nr:ABC transporter permease [bacterium]